MANSGNREKIAVLGSGIAALSAVFEITEQPGWQDKYDITVYQMGWRLGGRGASGRDAEGRIIEHGLHLWFGFYENAFSAMTRCFDRLRELGLFPDSPIRSIQDAFAPQGFYEYDEYVASQWVPWQMGFKVEPGEYPGDGKRLTSIAGAITAVLAQMEAAIRTFIERQDRPAQAGTHGGSLLDKAQGIATALHKALEGARHAADDFLHHVHDHHFSLQQIVEDFMKWFYKELETLEGELSQEMRRLKLLIEIAYYHIKGILADGVLLDPKGFEILNGKEYTQWLKDHGAPDDMLRSALISGVYDCAFCYKDGNPVFENRSVAAGTATYGMMRMFLTYQGAVFFKMNAGMGDVVFAPLYAVLKARGVKFQFFSRVTNLRLTEDKSAIAAIDLAQQVMLKSGEYDPLITVRTADGKLLPAWPNEPLYDQLAHGEQMQQMRDAGINVNLESFWTAWPDAWTRTLTAGADFDKVIMGISLGALPHVCGELIQASSAWQDMIANVPTVWTRQYELWMSKSADDLGTTTTNPLAMSYAEPGDVWTQMSHLLPVEGWQGPHKPQSLYYLGSVMQTPPDSEIPPPTDHNFPLRAEEMAYEPMLAFMQQEAHLIWPKGTLPDAPQSFDPSLLFTAQPAEGWARLAAQNIRANINPAERHPIAAPGTDRYKLAPGDSKFGRLYLAGDYTYVGILSFGCVEGAVISGLQCAQAILGYPLTIHH
jgi:uncharacterized protein with NAD-binding domain and iron-sulfur cluster